MENRPGYYCKNGDLTDKTDWKDGYPIDKVTL